MSSRNLYRMLRNSPKFSVKQLKNSRLFAVLAQIIGKSRNLCKTLCTTNATVSTPQPVLEVQLIAATRPTERMDYAQDLRQSATCTEYASDRKHPVPNKTYPKKSHPIQSSHTNHTAVFHYSPWRPINSHTLTQFNHTQFELLYFFSVYALWRAH